MWAWVVLPSMGVGAGGLEVVAVQAVWVLEGEVHPPLMGASLLLLS